MFNEYLYNQVELTTANYNYLFKYLSITLIILFVIITKIILNTNLIIS